MFDIDTGKLLIVGVLALIVIGPKDLPRVMRQVGQAIGRVRRMASEFQGQFMDAIKDAEIDDIRKELSTLSETAQLDVHFDPARDIQSELTGAMAEPVVTSDVTVSSPAHAFALPDHVADPQDHAASADDIPEPDGAFAGGVAPHAADEPDAIGLNGHAVSVLADRTKRKILIKPRRSTFGLVNSAPAAQAAGQAMVLRQRIVRPRRPVAQDVQPS